MMPKVHSKNIPFERAMRIFRRKVDNSGILQEVRKREYYEKPAQKKQRLKNAAKRRQQTIVEAEKDRMKRRPNHWH
jgi:small subunit ribosomal protein S21